VFFSRGSKLEFSFLLAGWGMRPADLAPRGAARGLRPETGLGTANRGRFSDAGVDALITQATTTIDDTRRGIMLGRASEKAVGELTGLVPLHYEVSTWATKKGLTYRARADQYTFAYDVRQTK
jgi:peptide/nickel transport system substrate-binding protein